MNCAHCGEAFRDGEPAQFIPNIGDEPQPFHPECWLRLMTGSLAHVEHRCSCFVEGASETDPAGMSLREGAAAAVAAWRKIHGPTQRYVYESPDCARLWRLDVFLSPQPAGDRYPTMEEVQAYVGGPYQVVHCIKGNELAYLFVREEGKIAGLRPNVSATAVLHAEMQRDNGKRSYSNYSTDNPFECLPAKLHDLVAGRALVWVGRIPPEELN